MYKYRTLRKFMEVMYLYTLFAQLWIVMQKVSQIPKYRALELHRKPMDSQYQ
jgi:hypothetical protein